MKYQSLLYPNCIYNRLFGIGLQLASADKPMTGKAFLTIGLFLKKDLGKNRETFNA